MEDCAEVSPVSSHAWEQPGDITVDGRLPNGTIELVAHKRVKRARFGTCQSTKPLLCRPSSARAAKSAAKVSSLSYSDKYQTLDADVDANGRLPNGTIEPVRAAKVRTVSYSDKYQTVRTETEVNGPAA